LLSAAALPHDSARSVDADLLVAGETKRVVVVEHKKRRVFAEKYYYVGEIVGEQGTDPW
jgi:hypothetical protein